MAHLSHTFTFPNLKPFSVNSTYIRTFSGVSKSSGAHEFCAQIFNVLEHSRQQAKLAELRSLFDPDKHAYTFSLTALYLEADYYTKKGQMSGRTVDCTNWEKIIVDCLCLPKFHEQPFPGGCLNLNMDDRFVSDVVSAKRPANKQAIQVTISIVDKPTLTIL